MQRTKIFVLLRKDDSIFDAHRCTILAKVILSLHVRFMVCTLIYLAVVLAHGEAAKSRAGKARFHP